MIVQKYDFFQQKKRFFKNMQKNFQNFFTKPRPRPADISKNEA